MKLKTHLKAGQAFVINNPIQQAQASGGGHKDGGGAQVAQQSNPTAFTL